MQLKKYTDYGLRVLMYLACQPPETMTNVKKICDMFNLSSNHVNKVVHHLAKLSLVKTKRGKYGGFYLAMAPQEINIAYVIRQLEGDEPWVECEKPACIVQPVCELRHIIARGKEQFYRYLGQYSLADIVRDNKQELQDVFILNLA